MFRPLRALPALYLRRSYLSLPGRNGTYNVQHVRLARPRGRAHKFAMTAVALAIPYYLLDSTADKDENEEKERPLQEAIKNVQRAAEAEELGPDGGIVDEPTASQELSVEEKGEDEDEDAQAQDAWFIPLGLPQQLPVHYYKGTDPEWQSFLQLARSPEAGRAVLGFVRAKAEEALLASPDIKRQLGKDALVSKANLRFIFPYNARTEFERWGIEVTNDEIILRTRPMDAIEAMRIQSTIYPTHFFDSLVAGVKAAIVEVYPDSRFKPPTPVEFPNIYDARRAASAHVRGSSPQAEAQQDQVAQSSSMTRADPRADSPWSRYLPQIPTPGPEVANVFNAFQKAYRMESMRKVLPLLMDPPRGSCRVRGFMELEGPRGRCMFDILADFDPAQKALTGFHIIPIMFEPVSQAAKGGP